MGNPAISTFTDGGEALSAPQLSFSHYERTVQVTGNQLVRRRGGSFHPPLPPSSSSGALLSRSRHFARREDVHRRLAKQGSVVWGG